MQKMDLNIHYILYSLYKCQLNGINKLNILPMHNGVCYLLLLKDNDNDNEVYSYPVLQACEIYTCTNIKLKIYNTKYTTLPAIVINISYIRVGVHLFSIAYLYICVYYLHMGEHMQLHQYCICFEK